MIWSALSLRSERGFRRMNMRPWFRVEDAPPAPMADMNSSTFGSAADNFRRRLLVLPHGVKGNVLGRLGDGKNLAGVLAGEKALGNHDEQEQRHHQNDHLKGSASRSGGAGPLATCGRKRRARR